MTGPGDKYLQTLWQTAEADSPLPAAEAIQARANALRSRLLRRNLTEYLAAGLVVCVFAAYAVMFPPLLCKLGAVLVCLASLLVSGILAWRGHPRQTDMGEDCLAFYVAELRRQSRLLRWVWLWYIAPFLPGLALFFIGLAQGLPPSYRIVIGPSIVVVAVIFTGIIWLNRHIARGLERTLQSLTQTNGA